MATIQWKYNYKTGLPGASVYYHGGSANGALAAQLEHFVTDHLNRSRSFIVHSLIQTQHIAERDVRNRARVRTGAMKRQVFSTGDYGTDVLKMRFGWRELEPYYAPFQEFGTRDGIEPMRAVYDAFKAALPRVQRMTR
jgi:hypothetical protein